MEPRAKEWLLATARGDYHAIARLLREEPRLARRRVRQLINILSFSFLSIVCWLSPDVIFCFHLFCERTDGRTDGERKKERDEEQRPVARSLSSSFSWSFVLVFWTCRVSSPSISVHLMRRRRPPHVPFFFFFSLSSLLSFFLMTKPAPSRLGECCVDTCQSRIIG